MVCAVSASWSLELANATPICGVSVRWPRNLQPEYYVTRCTVQPALYIPKAGLPLWLLNSQVRCRCRAPHQYDIYCDPTRLSHLKERVLTQPEFFLPKSDPKVLVPARGGGRFSADAPLTDHYAVLLMIYRIQWSSCGFCCFWKKTTQLMEHGSKSLLFNVHVPHCIHLRTRINKTEDFWAFFELLLAQHRSTEYWKAGQQGYEQRLTLRAKVFKTTWC